MSLRAIAVLLMGMVWLSANGKVCAQPEVANGALLKDPPRRMDDNQRGMQSMTVADFRAHLVDVTIPE